MSEMWEGGTPYIYFLECRGFGLIKIGCTAANIAKRMANYQKMCPFDLFCVGAYLAPSAKEEGRVHKLFGAHKHRNEWFFDGPEIRAYIETMCPRFDFCDFQERIYRTDLSILLRDHLAYNRGANQDFMESLNRADIPDGDRLWKFRKWLSMDRYPQPWMIEFAEDYLLGLEPPSKRKASA